MTIATIDSEQWFCPGDGICSFTFWTHVQTQLAAPV